MCELEGHPDNALPAVYGGIVIATSSRASIKLPAPRDLQAIVVVPEFDLATERARALLPIQYDRRDVVFNIQRAALLGAALASGSWNVLREAMNDRFHQPYRGAVVPGLAEALRVDSPELIGIALSGAGPQRAGHRARSRRVAPDRRPHRRLLRSRLIAARSYRLPFAARGLVSRRHLTERKAA